MILFCIQIFKFFSKNLDLAEKVILIFYKLSAKLVQFTSFRTLYHVIIATISNKVSPIFIFDNFIEVFRERNFAV